jgi:hypothetical protein
MNVQPDFPNHPKTRLLKRELGAQAGQACEFILRLWAHCQENQRGANWGKGVTAEYVEMVCEWPGEPGVLFTALLKRLMPGRTGFAEVNRKGEFIVHDWDEHNRGLLANWFRNPNGRAGANGKPKDGGGEASGKPRVPGGPDRGGPNKRGEDKRGEEKRGEGAAAPPSPAFAFAGEVEHPPTLEAVIAFGAALRPVCPEENCRRFWHHHAGKNWRAFTDFRHALVNWWEEDQKKNAGAGAGGKLEEWRREMEKIDTELGWQKDAGKIEKLKKRRAELSRKLS